MCWNGVRYKQAISHNALELRAGTVPLHACVTISLVLSTRRNGGMCGRFTQMYTWKEFVDLYNLTNPDILNLRPNWNVGPTQDVGVVVPEDGGRINKTLHLAGTEMSGL